jgi:hypothetical protein
MATAQLDSLLQYVYKLAAGRGSLQRTDRELLDDFSAHRDEAAFAALVARHGPMVLRVCRRVLNHEQDAEDAFQASYLILARKSASIRKREALSAGLRVMESILHGCHGTTPWRPRRASTPLPDVAARRAAAPGPASSSSGCGCEGPGWAPAAGRVVRRPRCAAAARQPSCVSF